MDRTARRLALATVAAWSLVGAHAVAATTGAERTTTSSLVGGSPVTPGTFGSLAFVTSQVSDVSAMACTGTVVAPAVVLTAAHCLTDDATGVARSAAGVTVTTGRTDRTAAGTGQVLTASRVIVDPAYDVRAITGDAALIVLSSATTAPPIALAGAAESGLTAGGTVATIAGWGLPSASVTTASAQLLSATTTILNDSACRRLLGSDFDVATTLCAVDEPSFAAATCRGDSGGPLIVRRADGTPVQAGIISWGSESCDAHVPQAYTRVAAHAGWIERQIAAAPTPPVQPGDPVPAPGGTGPARPQGGQAAAEPPLAHPGWWRGKTAQRRAVAVRVAGDGRAVASLRVALAGRCTGTGGRGRHSVRIVVATLPGTLGRLSAGRRFAGVRTSGHGVRLRVAGRFSPVRVAGTLSARWRAGAARCSSGPVAFSARR